MLFNKDVAVVVLPAERRISVGRVDGVMLQ